jgi:hypothetical protein
MASLLSTFLVSNGASDTRYQAKQGADTKPAAAGTEQPDRQGRKLRPAPAQEAARPDVDGSPPPGEAGRQGRNAKRLARPGETPDAARPAADGQVPAQATIERGPDGRKLTAKQRLSKRGRPGGEEPPRTEGSPKPEPGIDDKAKAETAKEDSGGPEAIKPAGEGKSEAARIEMPKQGSGSDTPVLRLDPVPPVTPAPPPASTATSAAASSRTSEPPAAARPSAPPEMPPTVSASAPPPPPPVAAAGPPAPPISQ